MGHLLAILFQQKNILHITSNMKRTIKRTLCDLRSCFSNRSYCDESIANIAMKLLSVCQQNEYNWEN